VADLRWSGDTDWARGALTALLNAQRENGSVPATLAFEGGNSSAFARIDLAAAIDALDEHDPDDAFIAAVYPAAAKYAEWLVQCADPGHTGLFDLDEGADDFTLRTGRAGNTVKGVDTTVEAYRLFRTLERLAQRAGGAAGDADRWRERADATMRAVRQTMWSDADESFADVDAATTTRTSLRSASAFLPFATDIAGAEHTIAVARWLLDPAQFWTAFPAPSIAVSDPAFNADGIWEGRRAARPMNGRVWPLRNAPIIDAIACVARERAPHLRETAAALLRRHVRMLFSGGDLRRVSGYEHYNPFSGRGSVYRGLDDVPHGALIDLLFRHVLGVHVRDGAIVVDPLPFGLEHAEGRGLRLRGRALDVVVSGERVTVTIDGVTRESRIGEPLVMPSES
jgi:glycogen debranching enzyme